MQLPHWFRGEWKVSASRWRDFLDASIERATGRQGRWTSDEDAELTSAVANTCKKKWGNEYKPDWDAVAVLVLGRTKRQCVMRWLSTLKPSIALATGSVGTWAEDEDKKLRDAVLTYGGKNWKEIAALIPGRTKLECYNRWRDGLNPSIALEAGHTGKWAEDEDNDLKDAVLTHGGKKCAIAALVPGRTMNQCYDGWRDALYPSIALEGRRTGNWVEDEVTQFKDVVLTRGDKRWKEIAALVPGLTSKQCCQKWRDMERNRSTVQERASGTLKKAPALRQDPHSP